MTFYVPALRLPVVAPPAPGNDPKAYYQGLGISVLVIQSAIDHGLKITASGAGATPLFAMFGGQVRYVPAGKALPFTAATSPAPGSLVLQVGATDVAQQARQFWPGFAAGTIVYCGIAELDARQAFGPLIHAMPDAIKASSWRATHGGANPSAQTDLDAPYLDRFIAGTACVDVPGGTKIGTVPLFQGFELRCANARHTPAYESPIELLRAAPTWLEGPTPLIASRWTGHPLVAALKLFPVTYPPPTSTIPPEASASDLAVKARWVIGPGNTKFARKYKRGVYNYGSSRVSAFTAAHPQRFQALSQSLIRVINGVSNNEGKLEAVNTWDNVFMTFGCLQWTAGESGGKGEIGALLHRLKTDFPAKFHDYFGTYGLDVEAPVAATTAPASSYIKINGTKLDTSALKQQLRDDVWAYRFWRAGHDDDVRETEVRHAISRIDVFHDHKVPALGNRKLSEVLTSEYGIALIFDQHVNRPGHVVGGVSSFTLNSAAAQFLANGGGANPASWTDADEASLLQTYLTLRASTSMTHSSGRAEQMQQLADAGKLSRTRGSFQK